MLVRELIEELSKYNPDLVVVLASDPEGNSYNEVSCVEGENNVWDGEPERSDGELRTLLVRLGMSIGVERYVGQGKTAAGHEFADNALAVIKTIEDRVVERLNA
jgi:hypothetical protein